jgi:hypothetical protein
MVSLKVGVYRFHFVCLSVHTTPKHMVRSCFLCVCSFKYLDIPPDPYSNASDAVGCVSSFVEIDGNRICGHHIDPFISNRSRNEDGLAIRFLSDEATVRGHGFRLSYFVGEYRIFLPIRRYFLRRRHPPASYKPIAPFTCTKPV